MSSSTDADKVVQLHMRQREDSAHLWHRDVVLDELDYISTPASPLRMWFILALCGLFSFALIASAIVKIDVYAIAQARVQPIRGSTSVQSRAAGRVNAIYVAVGDHVRKGDLLLEVDLSQNFGARNAAVPSSKPESEHSADQFSARTQGETEQSQQSDRARLVAPIDGVVEDCAVTTMGQVVSFGQHLLTVVPDDSALDVVAFVSSKDIASVRTGQRAILKLDAFPFTKYGVMTGTIIGISRTSLSTRETIARDGHQSSTNEAFSHDALFPITVKLDQSNVVFHRQSIPVLPGMTGRLEVLTGRSSALEYLLSPILEVTSDAPSRS